MTSPLWPTKIIGIGQTDELVGSMLLCFTRHIAQCPGEFQWLSAPATIHVLCCGAAGSRDASFPLGAMLLRSNSYHSPVRTPKPLATLQLFHGADVSLTFWWTLPQRILAPQILIWWWHPGWVVVAFVHLWKFPSYPRRSMVFKSLLFPKCPVFLIHAVHLSEYILLLFPAVAAVTGFLGAV